MVRHRHRPGGALFATVWVGLVVGALLSTAAGALWSRHVNAEASSEARNSVESVAATLDIELQRVDDFMSAEATLIALAGPDMSNSSFLAWFDRNQTARRFPGSLAFGYVQFVRPGQLADAVADDKADPPTGLGIPATATVFPPGQRADYCLLRVGVFVSHISRIPPLFDWCAPTIPSFGPSPTAMPLSAAATTGEPAVIGAAYDLRSLFDFYPVYDTPSTPPTAAARMAALQGWVFGTFDPISILNEALVGVPNVRASLLYTIPGSPPTLIGTVGTAPSSADNVGSSRLTAPGNWSARMLVGTGTGVSPTTQGVTVGALCLLVVLLLFLLVRLMATSRARLMRLVDEKTEQLRFQAVHDALTGLANRALILELASQMLARVEREGGTVAALFLDVDDFKDINDTFGHATGDRVLVEVASRLTAAVRAADRVGRLSGDEFVILAEDTASEGAMTAAALAGRVLHTMRQPIPIPDSDHPPLSITVSIGIDLATGGEPSDLLRNADVALYEAKAAGKDRYVIFRQEMQQAVHDRLELTGQLRAALERDELFLVFQPVFDLQAMKVRSLEALVRWRHPERGVVPPAGFIPLAEETDLIVPIGRFVLRAASTAAARWHADGHLVGVTVNVAGRQLDEPGFADDVGEALAASGLPAPFLTLEVTETQLLRDIDATSARLAVLRGLGVRVAIDDFGTGLSSLDHLRRLPVDSIKVDRSFVSVLGRSAEGASLVHSFIEMGKSLGLETLAEGIEEQSQLAELLKDRCDEGQGFLLARPLEEAEVGSFLAASGDFMVSAEPWPRAVQVQGSNGGRGHRIPRGGDVPPRR